MKKTTLGLEYLSSLAPWKGSGTFTLQTIQNVLGRLSNPQDSIPQIHIAGTNGKGSVSATVASILGQAGYKVGLSSSPHLEKLNERIVVDGFPVEDDFIGEFAYEIRSAANRAVESLTFHEAMTAVAFLGFREAGIEWGVIEVGLGGRLDSSNVIKRPAATAIVTIDFDHQNMLGDTLAEIATEKAGIIKAGVPHITGRVGPDAARVITKACTGHNVMQSRFGYDFDVRYRDDSKLPPFEYWDKRGSALLHPVFQFSPHLPGAHQVHNMAVASTVGLTVGMTHEQCQKGIDHVFWPARLEVIENKGKKIILDCAHNVAGMRSLTSFLDTSQLKDVDVIFGVLDTKNWREMVGMLRPYVRTWNLLQPLSERALDEELLAKAIRISGSEINIRCHGKDYELGLRAALEHSDERPIVIVGSMYMVGKVRTMLHLPSRPLWSKT